MKLANALSQRAELQTCIRQLEERLNNNAQVQEGEESAEDPMELLRELDEDYAQLEALIARINRTNSVTLVDGVPLSDLLARRDCMTGRLGILRGFLSSASSLVNRRTVGEIRIPAPSTSGSCKSRWIGMPRHSGSWMRPSRRKTGPQS